MNDKCVIWQTPARRIYTRNDFFFGFDSPRTGGQYVIRSDQRHSIRELLDDRGKARLTTWLANQRQQVGECPEISRGDIESAQIGQDMHITQRIDRVLQFLGTSRGQKPIGPVTLDPNPEGAALTDKIRAYFELLAHSESAKWQGDLKFLLELLEDGGLVHKLHLDRHHYSYTLTWRGFERVDELRKVTPSSSEAFVAMWFDDELKPAYVDGFKRAIEDAGYKPVRVDEQQFTSKIDDRIISEIRRSRFIVADFSQGEDGARGSVYYEAGFAHGLGLTVIFTCRKKDMNKVHFDTRQYPHIVWEDAEDLRNQLEKRIAAVMGDGPHRDRGAI